MSQQKSVQTELTHDRLTQKRLKIGELTVEQLFNYENTASLLVDELIKELSDKAAKEGKKGKKLIVTISQGLRGSSEKLIQQLNIKAASSNFPENLTLLVGDKRVALNFNQPVYKQAFQATIKEFLKVDPNSPYLVAAHKNKEWDTLNGNIVDTAYNRYNQKYQKGEKVTYVISGDFEPEWKASLEKALRADPCRPANLTIQLNDRVKYTEKHTVLFDGLQAMISNVEVSLPLTLDEQITALSFSSANASVQNALEEWKKSLAVLLNKAGNDPKKLQVVEGYVSETQNVIRSVDSMGSDPSKATQPELMSALQLFEKNVLKLSDDENVLYGASIFLGAAIGIAIATAICFTATGILPLLYFFLPMIVGVLIAHYGAGNAIELDAINPERKDSISTKLKEFGIFGEGPKHKARHFLEAVQKEKELDASQRKPAESGVAVWVVDQQQQQPQQLQVTPLVPVYTSIYKS